MVRFDTSLTWAIVPEWMKPSLGMLTNVTLRFVA